MKITNCQKKTGCLMRVAGRRLVPGESTEIEVSELSPFKCKVLLAKHAGALLRLEFANKKEEAEFKRVVSGEVPAPAPAPEAPATVPGSVPLKT